MGTDPTWENVMPQNLNHLTCLAAGPSAFHQPRRVAWRPAPLLPADGDGGHGGAGAGQSAADAAAAAIAAAEGAQGGAGAGQQGAGGQGAGQQGGTGAGGQQQGAGGQQGAKSYADMSPAERAEHYGYPADTRVAEMTPAQQAGYYRAKSDKLEQRERSGPRLSAAELKTLQEKAAKADALEYDLASDAERAAADARKAAEKEAAGQWAPRLAKAEVRAQLKAKGFESDDDIQEILGTINLSGLLTDAGDDVDPAKVTAALKYYRPDTGNQQQRRNGPSATGQGNRGQTNTTPGAAGLAEAERRFGKKQVAGASS